MTEINKTIPNLMSVKLFCENYPVFSTGSIRSYIFFSNSNGMDENKVIKRIGKKILIDVEAFFRWIDIKTMEG
jgi:hypothetical protein